MTFATAKSSRDTQRAACGQVLPGEAPEWVLLIPAGTFKPWDGRKAGPWHLKDAEAVIAASTAQGIDLVIDYEHQTEFAADNGQPAPAAGWVKELQVRDGAIWGRVEWTEKAAAMLRAKEYRYLSPTFTHDKRTGEVILLHRAALTNAPAAVGRALTSQQTEEDDSMDPILKALLAALGLPEDCDQDKALAKVKELTAGATAIAATKAALKPLRDSLKLGEDADVSAITSAAVKAIQTPSPEGAEPDPTKYVPRSEFDLVRTSLSQLQADLSGGKATAAVDAAIADGKVTPANRDWAMAYAKKDPDGFAEFVGKAPVVVKPGSQLPAKKPAAGELDTDEKALCKQLGITEEAFKKARDEENAA